MVKGVVFCRTPKYLFASRNLQWTQNKQSFNKTMCYPHQKKSLLEICVLNEGEKPLFKIFISIEGEKPLFTIFISYEGEKSLFKIFILNEGFHRLYLQLQTRVISSIHSTIFFYFSAFRFISESSSPKNRNLH